ncbi:oligosaccharide flippase family protein [Vibrio alginolyticus]|uniref:lipopolysaccharide biosynthesis protein n=1 Tax=Vibrio alginolyticus TaxID=663 RepID=UPI0037501499
MNIRKLLKSGSIITLINIVTALVGVVGVFYISKSLGLKNSGEFYFIISFIMIIIRVLNVSPWQAVIKFHSEKQSIIYQGIKLETFGAMVTILIFISSYKISLINIDDDNLQLLVLIVGVLSILCRSNGTLIGYLRLKNKFNIVEIFRCIGEFSKLISFFIINVNSPTSVENALISFIVGEMIVFASYVSYSIYISGKGLKEVFKIFYIKIDRDFLKYAILANFNASLVGSVKTADEYVLGIISDSTSVGIYKIIKTTASSIGLITDPLQMLIFPDFVYSFRKGGIKNSFSKIRSVHTVLASVSVLVLALTYYLWPYVVWLITENSSIENRLELMFYLLSVLVLANFFYLQPACMALGYVLKLLYINIISVTLFFFMCFVINLFLTGLFSVILSYLIFSLSSVAMRIYILRRGVNAC